MLYDVQNYVLHSNTAIVKPLYSMLYVKHNLARWIFIMRANDDIYCLEKPLCLDSTC